MTIKESIREKIGKLGAGEFEVFCCHLMAAEFEEYKTIESSRNWHGSSIAATPDAYVRNIDGSCTLFQFTTEKNNIKTKVLKDVDKIIAVKDRFDSIKRITVCASSPLTNVVEDFRRKCREFNWEAEDFSLDKLVYFAEKHPDICSDHLKIVFNPEISAQKSFRAEKYYDCGKRISEIRSDITLLPSQFIELIDYPSEKLYKQMESGEEECGEQTITKIFSRTGAAVDWIKHGIGDKYPVERYWTLSHDSIKRIAKEYPKKIILTIQKENLAVRMLVYFDSYKWEKYDLKINIDFWNWFDDKYYIPRFYKFLMSLQNTFYTNYHSVILTKEQDDFVYAPQTHPHQAQDILSAGHGHWAGDLTDIDFEFRDKENYAELYGEWFPKVQEELVHFRSYFEKQED